MGDHLILARLTGIEPPLAGEGCHAHQHLGIHRRQSRRQAVRLELLGEEVLHLACDIDDEAGEGPCLLRHGGVAHEDAESVGLGLDVFEERHACLLEELARMRALQSTADHREQLIHLAIDDNGVEPLLAAEVLVDHGLGDAGGGGDLLDADGFEALVGEQGPADGDELFSPLPAGHAHSGVPLA